MSDEKNPKTTKALRKEAKTVKASKARTAEVGIVDFCCLELTLLPAQEQARWVTKQDAL